MFKYLLVFTFLFINLFCVFKTQGADNMNLSQIASVVRSPIHEKFKIIVDEKKLTVPATVVKIHGPHQPGDKDHIHFRNGYIYEMNGKWYEEHGLNLRKETLIFIEALGFPTPQRNDNYLEEGLDLPDTSPTTYTVDELKKMTGLESIPTSVRAVHEAHGNGQQLHIHFVDDDRSLNKDGTWESNFGRDLTSEEEQFALRLNFTLPVK
jgi:hypothetical protein